MSGATTLDGYFFEDEGQNLVQRLEHAIAMGRLKEPSRVLVSWQEQGHGTFPTLLKKDIAPLAVPGIRPLCEELKSEIERQKGLEPSGTLKIRVFESGRSADNAVDFTRKIRPAAEADGGTPLNAEMLTSRLLARLCHLEQINVQKDAQIAANTAIIGNIAVEQARTIATLATQRSVATTASDMGGLTTIIGLLVLAFSWPVVRNAFNLPKNASINDLLALAQANTAAFMKRARRSLETEDANELVDAPPTPRTPEQLAEAPPAAPLAPELPDPDLIIAGALNNPAYREKLRERLMAHWTELAA